MIKEILTRAQRGYSWEHIVSPIYGTGKSGFLHAKFEPLSYTLNKSLLQMDKRLLTMKLLKENLGEGLLDIGLGKGFWLSY